MKENFDKKSILFIYCQEGSVMHVIECPVCGKTRVTINKADKYCQTHYETWWR